MNRSDALLFASEALVVAVERRLVLGEFKPQELANTAWAFVGVDRSDADAVVFGNQVLISKLVAAVERRLGEFDLRDLAGALWAFAAAGRSDALFFVCTVVSE